jgi:hypothetical protein
MEREKWEWFILGHFVAFCAGAEVMARKNLAHKM